MEKPTKKERTPQLEDGFTRIANEILDAIAQTSLSDYESRCIHFLWRKTYGWQNPAGQSKKLDAISQTQWSRGTDINRRSVAKVLSRLVQRNIVIKQTIYNGSKRIILWGFQKRYNQWLTQSTLSSKQTIGKGIVHRDDTPALTIIHIDDASDSTIVHIDDTLSSKQTIDLSSKQTHTKEKKETVQKIYYTGETEILKTLKGLNGWNFEKDEDKTWLYDFMNDYPDLQLADIKACGDYYSGRVSPKHKGVWKNRFRNWMMKKQEFERRKGEQPQKGVRPKPPQERKRGPIPRISGD